MRDIIPRPEQPSGGFMTGWWFGILNIGVVAVVGGVWVAIRRGPLDGLIFGAWGIACTVAGSLLFGSALAGWRAFQGWLYDRYLGRDY